eukprot:COSAG02_NODE_2011_length_10119_cov_11.569960_9_plen_82_part_00
MLFRHFNESPHPIFRTSIRIRIVLVLDLDIVVCRAHESDRQIRPLLRSKKWTFALFFLLISVGLLMEGARRDMPGLPPGGQ